jgi:hypothetical protein
MGEVIGVDPLKEINLLAGETGNASGDLRNFIVHGQPFKIVLSDGHGEMWAKFAARKGGVRGLAVRLSKDYVEAQTGTVKALIDRWVAVRELAHKKLVPLHSDYDSLGATG